MIDKCWFCKPWASRCLKLFTIAFVPPPDMGAQEPANSIIPIRLASITRPIPCQQPGPPCVVSGYGCTRHDLPKDTRIFEQCASTAGLEGGNPLDNILDALDDRANSKGLTGNPVDMDKKKLDEWKLVDCASNDEKRELWREKPSLKSLLIAGFIPSRKTPSVTCAALI